MTKRWCGIVIGALFVAWAIPGRGQENPWSGFSQLQEQLERESARMRAQLEKGRQELAARIDQLLNTELTQELATLQAESAKLRAEVVGDKAGMLAELAAQQAPMTWDPDDMDVMMEGDRGWLGVTITEVTTEKAKELKLPAEQGVILTEVEADGPAAKAGLKANDVVTEYNGQRVEGTAQFRRLIRETPAGRTVQLTISRDGRTQKVSLQLGSFRDHFVSRVRPFGPKDFKFKFELPEIGGNIFLSRTPMLGISAEDLSGQLGSYFGALDGEAILVREVKPGTPAEKAGLKAGDVITKVDGVRVQTVSDLREKLRDKRDKKTVSLSVLRKGTEMSLNVEVEQPKPPEQKKLIGRRTYL
jgi:serine protease Do